MTMTRQPDLLDPATLIADVLARLHASADRSDPLDETVLCLLESATHAAVAADRVKAGATAEPQLRAALAAARAAVVAAGYALTGC